MRSFAGISVGCALLTFGLNACIATTDVGGDGDVAVVEQALGGYTAIKDFNSNGDHRIKIGPTYTVFHRPGAGCSIVEVVRTVTGESLQVPQLPGCPRITNMLSESIVLVVDAASGYIYQLGTNFIYDWIPLVDTGAAYVEDLAINDTDIFWYDGYWLSKTSRTTLQTSRGPGYRGYLIDVDGSDLYVQNALGGQNYELAKYTWSGNNVTFSSLARFTSWVGLGYTADANYIYWAQNADTSAIRRVSKAGSAIVDVKTSTSVMYYAPVSTGSALYWLEETRSTRATSIRRKNLVNGNVTSSSFPFLTSELNVFSDGLYFSYGDTLYRTSR